MFGRSFPQPLVRCRPPWEALKGPRRHVQLLHSLLDNPYIHDYLKYGSNPINIRDTFRTARNMTPQRQLAAGQYVQKEIPIRLAQSIRSFHSLPYTVNMNSHMLEVLITYIESFEAIRKSPRIVNEETNRNFAQLIQRLALTHQSMLYHISLGISMAKELPPSLAISHEVLDAFMDKFVIHRLARRVLAAHHYALLHGGKSSTLVGIFDTKCKVKEAVEAAAAVVTPLCTAKFHEAPEVILKGDTSATLCYIREHLEYILIEIFKNAMRHTMKHRLSRGKKGPVPPVVVHACSGKKLTLVVSDQGGGFQGLSLKHAWDWGGKQKATTSSLSTDAIRDGFSQRLGEFGQTGRTPIPELSERIKRRVQSAVDGEDLSEGESYLFREWIRREHASDMGALTAGHHGLPIARIYARYLGGDIDVESIAGHGSRIYISLASLDDDHNILF